ncbi:hypothetical protein VTO73DRAFT_4122 [Trametes versicolor]
MVDLVPHTTFGKDKSVVSAELPEAAPGRNGHDMKIDPARLEELSIQTELDDLLEERKTIRTEEEKEKAWTDAADMVKTYSDEMVERWNRVIDTYLVFAGLFSAILTAFNVQSYPLLQPGTPDPVAILQQISLQLHSFTVNPPFVNSTTPPAVGSSPPSAASGVNAVPRSAIWLNILWFSGLILSLTSALMGILVKQWLNEYVSLGVSGNSREAARLRQYRLNNLVKWRVEDIVILIPVLLLISLGLFLAGLLILLWTLHQTVAIVATVLVGVVGVFTIGVTFLPLFNNGCAYLTPQSFAFYSVWRHTLYPIFRPLGYYTISVPAQKLWWKTPVFFPAPFDIINDILRGARDLFPDTSETFAWHTRERRTVDSLHDNLDLEILNKAYQCTRNVKAVSAAAVCLLDQDSIPVLDYFTQLNKAAGKCSIRSFPKDELLVYQVLLCASQLNKMKIFTKDCGRVWGCSPCFLPTVRSYATQGSSALASQSVWLQKTASWLEHRVLNPDTSKIMPPSALDGGLHDLRSRRLNISGEGKMTTHELGLLWSDTVPNSSHQAFHALHREALRWLQFATCTRKLRDYTDCDARPSHIQGQLCYLRSVRELLPYASRILSSSDSSGPRDHHVIRAETFAVLSGLHDFLRFLRTMNREDLRHFSHDHLDNLSDVVNGLIRDRLVLFPLIQSQNESCGETWEYAFWCIAIYLGSQRRKSLVDTEADMIQSLDNFKSAQDSYEHQYRSWRLDVRQVLSSIRVCDSPVLTYIVQLPTPNDLHNADGLHWAPSSGYYLRQPRLLPLELPLPSLPQIHKEPNSLSSGHRITSRFGPPIIALAVASPPSALAAYLPVVSFTH